ncbi:hypothetical protein INS49_013680 [Diaporthe citri]|uniref:uncharacterized protein n=1 Tax=Diaporthe citri TaxID=83186 RepID=UPI001C812B63|nr:uncharacterized protein INS49_013680 [Diaporthe citri]KAG6357801.1 hypothetical protein INS49_013680 [Diaporthe citri]
MPSSFHVQQQIKAGGVHYNVAWSKGLNACGNNFSIAPESSPACGDRFEVDGNKYSLEGCADPDNGYAQAPAQLLRGDGPVFGSYEGAYKKLGFNGSTDDVVKRYLCG